MKKPYFAGGRKPEPREAPDFDVMIVGAGFMGIYMAYRAKCAGLRARVVEAGSNVGGTWYWNRYPGAGCDIESFEYSYAFSEELEQEWKWSSRFPTQPEIEAYLNHVTDRFGLRDMMQFDTRVASSIYDAGQALWRVTMSDGTIQTSRFVVFAVGELGQPADIRIPGLDRFKGRILHTFDWPDEEVDLSGKRVGVIGTGSSGIQVIPILAKQAAELVVFQRTPNFSVPLNDEPIDEEFEAAIKSEYPVLRRLERNSESGIDLRLAPLTIPSSGATEEEIEAEFERRWEAGGLYFMSSYTDIMANEVINEKAADFIRRKIRAKIKDPQLAEKLLPKGYPFGSKRPCADRGYFETFNRDNVSLVDLREDPITGLVETGVETRSGLHEFDVVVFATGFDAVTGAIGKIDIRGEGGVTLKESWENGPRTYLGFMTHGFPNMFMANLAHVPYDTYNTIRGVEFTGEWISDAIEYMRRNGYVAIDATREAEADFTKLISEIAKDSLLLKGNSWYLGSNIPGKPRVVMSWFDGFQSYKIKVLASVRNDYEGFRFSPVEALPLTVGKPVDRTDG